MRAGERRMVARWGGDVLQCNSVWWGVCIWGTSCLGALEPAEGVGGPGGVVWGAGKAMGLKIRNL